MQGVDQAQPETVTHVYVLQERPVMCLQTVAWAEYDWIPGQWLDNRLNAPRYSYETVIWNMIPRQPDMTHTTVQNVSK